jgi:hypothetical protein
MGLFNDLLPPARIIIGQIPKVLNGAVETGYQLGTSSIRLGGLGPLARASEDLPSVVCLSLLSPLHEAELKPHI